MTKTEIQELNQAQRKYFNTGITKTLDFRIKMLKLLKKAILENEDKLYGALKNDLNKPEFESFGGEIGFVIMDIDFMIKKLPGLMKPRKVPTPIFHWPGKSFIISEPYGTALIIAPWNYPFQLLFSPLVGCISGGNCAVMKPSSVSSNTSHIIAKLIRDNFPEEYLAVVEISGREANILLEKKFDMIFYTGSTEVGRSIMTAAAKHLTPVVLELGGKSPCIVDKNTNLKKTARRIVWGKFFNGGQSCVAPDYVLADKKIKPYLLEAMKKEMVKFYGNNPETSPFFCRIITKERTEQLSSYFKDGDIVAGGIMNMEQRYISPTILDNVSFESPVMQEEIFGPVLPVIEYEDMDWAIQKISERPKPLTLYLFSNDQKIISKVLAGTSSGSVCINDALSHYTSHHLPFGGIGDSGMGKYHGKAGFDSFTHKKSIMKKGFLIDYGFRYPPYMKLNRFIKKVIRMIS